MRLIKSTATVWMLVCSTYACSQVTDIDIVMHAPPPNALVWDDVWNVSIYNNIMTSTMPTTIDVTVKMTWRNTVYEAVTDKFIVPVGTTKLNAEIAKTKNLEILAEYLDHKAFFTKYNTMKYGGYSLCATLRLYNPLGDVLYQTTSCAYHEFFQFGLINLNTPYEGDTVLSESLQFMWTHVNDHPTFYRFYYKLDLVEIIGDQTPATAMALNPKRLTTEEIENPYLDYPQIERPLDTGKAYAWRVIGYTDASSTTEDQYGQSIPNPGFDGQRTEVARSDIGYFICGSTKNRRPGVLKQHGTKHFIDLKHWSQNETYYFNSTLPVSLYNPYARRNLAVRIYNDKRELLEIDQPGIWLEPGLNAINIDLSSEQLVGPKFYFAELELSDKEIYKIKLYKASSD